MEGSASNGGEKRGRTDIYLANGGNRYGGGFIKMDGSEVAGLVC